MVPSERRSLEATLAQLHNEQIKAIEDATYIGWTQVSRRDYDERGHLIRKIRQQLELSDGS